MTPPHAESGPRPGSRHVAGTTSTGSKRPAALFGSDDGRIPHTMTRASGMRVWDERGREYIDYIMGLGAVALGYAHPEVDRAATAAIEAGNVGPLAPELEEEVAAILVRHLGKWVERVRFLKTGAEAVQASVRLARVHTGREVVLTCGYHGWLDWCQAGPGVPRAVQALRGEIPFNNQAESVARIEAAGESLAALVVEPVIDGPPDQAWLEAIRDATRRVGALLIVDEIKTAFRVAMGGVTERHGVSPDLIVVGKALANGFPLAAVGGGSAVMSAVDRTWISSTLATESVALAAAKATLDIMARERVPDELLNRGQRLVSGLEKLAIEHPAVIEGVVGVPQMCYLRFTDEAAGSRFVRAAASRGVLWKRNAYNFVSLAHTEAVIDQTLSLLDESAGAC